MGSGIWALGRRVEGKAQSYDWGCWVQPEGKQIGVKFNIASGLHASVQFCG